MNIKSLLLAMTSVLMLSGCALTKSNNEQHINPINHAPSANYEAYGAERMDVIGMAAIAIEKRCSAFDFMQYVTKTYPETDDIINLRMEETVIKKGSDTTYTCSYSGLAVSYTPLSIEEAKKWQAEKKVPKNEVIVVEKKPEATECKPCLCVPCGCTPCASINNEN